MVPPRLPANEPGMTPQTIGGIVLGAGLILIVVGAGLFLGGFGVFLLFVGAVVFVIGAVMTRVLSQLS